MLRATRRCNFPLNTLHLPPVHNQELHATLNVTSAQIQGLHTAHLLICLRTFSASPLNSIGFVSTACIPAIVRDLEARLHFNASATFSKTRSYPSDIQGVNPQTGLDLVAARVLDFPIHPLLNHPESHFHPLPEHRQADSSSKASSY